MASSPRTVHRTACIRLRLIRHQADRCYALLRAAGDLWAWLIDCNRQRRQQNTAPVVGYQALCRELTGMSGLGELSVAGARSVVQRYSVAWFEAERRRRAGTAGGSRAVSARSCRSGSTTAGSSSTVNGACGFLSQLAARRCG